MLEFLEEIGRASVWSFWAPVVVWTGLSGVVAFGLGRSHRLHPIAGYRLRQALFLALPVSVVAAAWVPGLLPPVPAPVDPVQSATGAAAALSSSGGVSLYPGSGHAVDVALVPLGAAVVVVLVLAVARLAILAADLRQLGRIRRVAQRVDDPTARGVLRQLAEKLGVRRPVELLEGPPDSAPMTFGAWTPVILVPRSMLDAPELLGPVLAHELVHIRRADYAWAMLDRVISSVFAFHPMVALLRRGIERCRETSCDAEVVTLGIVRPTSYAELLAYAHTPSRFPMPAVAASMSAPPLTLKERLESMKRFSDRRFTSRQRAGTVLGAAAVFLIVALAGACATRGEEEARRAASRASVSPRATYLTRAAPRISDLDYTHAVEPGSVGDTPTFRIPPPIGTGIRYYPEATEPEVMDKLKELDVQIQYLRERIAETSEAMDKMEVRDQEYDYLFQRYELLRSVHAEHVRVAELTMLQYETARRLRRGSSE